LPCSRWRKNDSTQSSNLAIVGSPRFTNAGRRGPRRGASLRPGCSALLLDDSERARDAVAADTPGMDATSRRRNVISTEMRSVKAIHMPQETKAPRHPPGVRRGLRLAATQTTRGLPHCPSSVAELERRSGAGGGGRRARQRQARPRVSSRGAPPDRLRAAYCVTGGKRSPSDSPSISRRNWSRVRWSRLEQDLDAVGYRRVRTEHRPGRSRAPPRYCGGSLRRSRERIPPGVFRPPWPNSREERLVVAAPGARGPIFLAQPQRMTSFFESAVTFSMSSRAVVTWSTQRPRRRGRRVVHRQRVLPRGLRRQELSSDCIGGVAEGLAARDH